MKPTVLWHPETKWRACSEHPGKAAVPCACARRVLLAATSGVVGPRTSSAEPMRFPERGGAPGCRPGSQRKAGRRSGGLSRAYRWPGPIVPVGALPGPAGRPGAVFLTLRRVSGWSNGQARDGPISRGSSPVALLRASLLSRSWVSCAKIRLSRGRTTNAPRPETARGRIR